MDHDQDIGFHVTPVSNIASILAEGLRVTIGARSTLAKERLKAIWVFPGDIGKDTLEDAITNWMSDAFEDVDEPLALVLVRYDKSRAVASPGRGEIAVSSAVPPASLHVLSMNVEDDFRNPEFLNSHLSWSDDVPASIRQAM